MSIGTLRGTTRLRDDLVRSAMAGASTGGRAFTALATQALTARTDATTPLDAALARPWVRGTICVLALGELVADKLPMAPSRLELPGLSGRIVASAACGAVIARREPDPLGGGLDDPTVDPTALPGEGGDVRNRTFACALAGATAAIGAAWCGSTWRAAVSSRTGDWVGAGLEDVAVLGLAAAAARAG